MGIFSKIFKTKSSSDPTSKKPQAQVKPKINSYLNSDLIDTVKNHDVEGVRNLLEAGADPNAIRDNGSALIWAVGTNLSDMVKLFIDYGADVDFRTNDGTTPLMVAAAMNNTGIGRMLIDSGADINARSMIGWTALMGAIRSKHVEFVNFLLDMGADINTKSLQGYTPRNLAEKYSLTELLPRLNLK